MKRLNLILIATAFFLTTACTETETVTPFNPSEQATYVDTPNDSYEVTIEQAPNEEASFDAKKSKSCTNCSHRTEAAGGEHFGELLPASFIDCGTFIRKSDGSLLEVLNANLPERYAETGAQIRFGYVEVDLRGACDLGTAIKLTYIQYAQKQVDTKAVSKTNNTGTH